MTLRGERSGEGVPTVLCHGLTATRRYVVHGSSLLQRRGHEVIAYDARAHGSSDPAPPGGGYGYSELVGDLEAVVRAAVGERAVVLAGHSMGAHTAVSGALAGGSRLAALVLIGPVYNGAVASEAVEHFDGLATALEEGGVEGFAHRVDEDGLDPAWRETVLRITRERMSLHRHPDDLARALREVPRSKPFEEMTELESLDVPTLVVASHDVADPGHPRAVAEAYAARIPGAVLVGEGEGESPLAWQGGRLSREIAAFCECSPVAERLH
ncbi:MAG: alpha/beta fold hydrolase [Solirubrobacterales bacterium]